ncbi:MAG: polysaccharide deacetylase family protein [Clostridia bacterium]|nr:polysaccharide deacetylase family protein [Clostridia bacterium]
MSKLFMSFPEGKQKAMTFSYDDGVKQDKRLAEIFLENNLCATFNINSSTIGGGDNYLTKDDALRIYSDPHFEVALHGLTHPFLNKISPECATYEIIEDKVNLEKMFGKIVRGMAYPYGCYDDTVLQILKNAGILYSRTIHDSGSFDFPTNWLELSPTCHHNASGLEELADRFIFDNSSRKPEIFYVWGHSYEFDNDDNWDLIESFAKKVSNKNDIWYATNIQIFDYALAFSRMEFSADGSLVHNPTATDLWFEHNDKCIKVRSGETATVK